MLEQPHFHPQLVAGHHRTAQAQAVDAGEHEEGGRPLGACRRGHHRAEGKQRSRLRHRLGHQHARHHRASGKMAVEERLVDTHVLEREHTAVSDLEHAVDHQKRVAMRQPAEQAGEVARRGRIAIHSAPVTSRCSNVCGWSCRRPFPHRPDEHPALQRKQPPAEPPLPIAGRARASPP
jgi:hypothetical protein